MTAAPSPAASTTTQARPVVLLVAAQLLAVLTLACIAGTVIGGLASGGSIFDALPFVVLLLVTLAVGWLLAVRVPRHPMGWILMAIPALFTVEAPLALIASSVKTTAPDVARWIDWFNGTDAHPSWAWLPPVWILLAQLPLRFPDGRLPSPRWRWFSRFSVVALVAGIVVLGTTGPTVQPGEPNPAYLPALGGIPLLVPLAIGVVAVCFIGSIASLFVRYHHAGAQQRAQLRWMVWAVAVAVAGLLISWLIPVSLDVLDNAELVLYGLIPIAVAVAVLRYRLYEIDRIISRTAAYALVTLVVVGTYAVVVLGVQALLPGLQSVGVALATLAAAAVFFPVLRWVRRLIDRVFNRSQYNAERVLESFGERIRNGADPHSAGVDLVTAIGQTLQPTAVGLWARKDI